MTERPWEPLRTERPINTPYRGNWSNGSRTIDGIEDWSGVPHPDIDPDDNGRNRFKIPERAQYTDENYLEGIDWKQYEDRDAVAREYPLRPRGENVGQQFIDRIEPIFSKQRRRPLSHTAYSVHLMTAPKVFGNTGYELKLAHNGLQVGTVGWSGDDGHVSGLDVLHGHRHMVTKLLQEAWDLSRTRGHVGPAASGELTDFSGKILKKFNPEAYEYRHSEYAYQNDPENFDGDRSDYEDDDEYRWERSNEQAWENHRYTSGEPCETCGGAGESRLAPRTTIHRTEDNRYATRFTGPGEYVESAIQSIDAYDGEGEHHEFEYQHPNAYSGTVTLPHSPEKEGYVQNGVIRAEDSDGTQIERPVWTKPCSVCGHLANPGFPNHDGN